ncbi:MAG: hypothetical protein EAZ23_00990 [Oscillatoriales cyanobacterium]|nr:MAG: hypothetical protein EAZ23_00990 [Oscillatoriales cyanobacterium]
MGHLFYSYTNGQRSTVNGQRSTVNSQQSTVNSQQNLILFWELVCGCLTVLVPNSNIHVYLPQVMMI